MWEQLQQPSIEELVLGRARDTPTVGREIDFMTMGNNVRQCLSSTVENTIAPLGSGLYKTIGNQVLINHVDISGAVVQTAVTQPGSLEGWYAPTVRKLLVWYDAPGSTPDEFGTLPPITEVMEDITIASLPKADLSGRWTILWEKTFHLGWAVQREGGTAEQDFGVYTSTGKQYYKARVKVDKMTTYADRSTRGSPGGHWSSDSDLGRVNTGLLIMYTQYEAPVLMPIIDTCNTRVNYTG